MEAIGAAQGAVGATMGYLGGYMGHSRRYTGHSGGYIWTFGWYMGNKRGVYGRLSRVCQPVRVFGRLKGLYGLLRGSMDHSGGMGAI